MHISGLEGIEYKAKSNAIRCVASFQIVTDRVGNAHFAHAMCARVLKTSRTKLAKYEKSKIEENRKRKNSNEKDIKIVNCESRIHTRVREYIFAV